MSEGQMPCRAVRAVARRPSQEARARAQAEAEAEDRRHDRLAADLQYMLSVLRWLRASAQTRQSAVQTYVQVRHRYANIHMETRRCVMAACAYLGFRQPVNLTDILDGFQIKARRNFGAAFRQLREDEAMAGRVREWRTASGGAPGGQRVVEGGNVGLEEGDAPRDGGRE